MLFHPPVGPLSFDEIRHLSAKRMHMLRYLNLLSAEHALSDTRKPSVILRNLFFWDPSPTVKMSISYGMFTNVIRSLGSERHYQFVTDAEDGHVSTRIINMTYNYIYFSAGNRMFLPNWNRTWNKYKSNENNSEIWFVDRRIYFTYSWFPRSEMLGRIVRYLDKSYLYMTVVICYYL